LDVPTIAKTGARLSVAQITVLYGRGDLVGVVEKALSSNMLSDIAAKTRAYVSDSTRVRVCSVLAVQFDKVVERAFWAARNRASKRLAKELREGAHDLPPEEVLQISRALGE